MSQNPYEAPSVSLSNTLTSAEKAPIHFNLWLSRILAIAIFAIFIAVLMYRVEVRQYASGKDNFLTAQALRFDRLQIHQSARNIFFGVFIGFLLGVYELLAFIIKRLIGIFSKQSNS